MPNIITETIGVELRNHGVYACDFEALDVNLDANAVQLVIDTSTEHLVRPPAEDYQVRESRAVSPACEAAAQELFSPVISSLFSGESYYLARERWSLFGVNYYETGERFPSHTDFRQPERETVVILSLCGIRRLEVQDNPFVELKPGVIAFLDGRINPRHAVECLEGPSISVVADVPDVLWEA